VYFYAGSIDSPEGYQHHPAGIPSTISPALLSPMRMLEYLRLYLPAGQEFFEESRSSCSAKLGRGRAYSRS